MLQTNEKSLFNYEVFLASSQNLMNKRLGLEYEFWPAAAIIVSVFAQSPKASHATKLFPNYMFGSGSDLQMHFQILGFSLKRWAQNCRFFGRFYNDLTNRRATFQRRFKTSDYFYKTHLQRFLYILHVFRTFITSMSNATLAHGPHNITIRPSELIPTLSCYQRLHTNACGIRSVLCTF